LQSGLKDQYLNGTQKGYQQINYMPTNINNDKEKMIDFKGNFLFGPFAANYKLDDKFCSELLKRANKLKPATANTHLAGVLSDQRLYTKEDKEYFVNNFQYLCSTRLND
jgi:hypothetical protein